MFVTKRNGTQEPVQFDKISSRLKTLCARIPNTPVDVTRVAQSVIAGIYDGVSTSDLDILAAETSASFASQHTDYAALAGYIAVSNLHKETPSSFLASMTVLHGYINTETNRSAPMISDSIYDIVCENIDLFESAIDYERDYNFNYFGFKTLERSYLLKVNDKVLERPQSMYMRVALGIHGNDLESVLSTYDYLSHGIISHASPTLFSSGTPKPQLSSCFLLKISEDSISGIFDTLGECARISKAAGGIGLAISDVRAKGSYIEGTNGTSNGIVPMLKVFNNTAKYVDQGGNKRPGAFACYLEPWHADVFDFLDLKKNTGMPDARARDLFYALWIPDLFMERVKTDGHWTLMCPRECPGLTEVYGKDFVELYTKYEKEKKGMKTIKAQELWEAIIDSQIETGTPYMLYKDACNEKSNQKNLGTIKSSNLCAEIVEYTDEKEIAVCNLASICLPKFVNKKDKSFDLLELHKTAKLLTYNLNKVIDNTTYPVEKAQNSNNKHRPIGIGVQGLADVFAMLHMPFESQEAFELNSKIFEIIYHGALEASCDLAKQDGPYASFIGSPASEGILQFDFWKEGQSISKAAYWKSLKKNIKTYGLRNSLLIAPMPTASTAQILGNNEACEPFTSNLYARRVLSGEFQCVNKHLQEDLQNMGLWTTEVKQRLLADNGSIQNIDAIPEKYKNIYKTVWEMSQKSLIDMAAQRGMFIDQSQSFNVFIANPTYAKMTSMHFYGWAKGLKTGMYYLRSKPAASPIKFTVDATLSEQMLACSIENKDDCLMCGA